MALLTFRELLRGLPPVDEQPLLVSVVVPTLDRPDYLRRALRSIAAQTHEHWEVLVVDVGTVPSAAAIIADLADPRFRVVVAPARSNSGAARNAGLAAARGAVITYLDDDNAMGPDWLAAVAWAFARDPDAEVAYGGRIFEAQGQTHFLLRPFDRRGLERKHLTDTNVLAHRPGLPGARWDEELRCAEDWDLIARLTARRDPVVLPVLAAVCDTSSPNRRSDKPIAQEEYEAVRRRIRERRPLRILGVNALFPLLSETYIHDELHALELLGAELAWCRLASGAPAPMRVGQEVFEDLEVAITRFAPDVLFLHWATFAHEMRGRLTDVGIPYGVRVHSFDFDADLVADLVADPLCVGVWRYPSTAYEAPGTHLLPPIFSTVSGLGAPRQVRDVVLSASAGLPKKDWPTLVDAFGALAGVDTRILTAVTTGHEDEPRRVVDLATAAPFPPLVQVNATRDVVHALLGRTACFVYTLDPAVRFGMPMSVAEALCAGCSVVVPDRPEARAYAGPSARVYRTADDIAAHARDVLAAGPHVLAEQEANRVYGTTRFCDPLVPERFLAELTTGLEACRRELART